MTKPTHKLWLQGGGGFKKNRVSLWIPLFVLMIVSINHFQSKAQCSCPGTGSSLFTGGDFPTASCHNSFGSDFSWMGCTTFPAVGQITEGDNADAIATAHDAVLSGKWCGLDHTTGGAGHGSGFLIANGFTGTSTTNRVWYKSAITVTPGQAYRFDAFVINLCTDEPLDPELPTVELAVSYGTTVDNVHTETSMPVTSTCAWTELCGVWTAPAGVTSVELDIFLPDMCGPRCGSGNDIGIDDITFKTTGPPNSDFTYTTVSCNNPITFTPVDGTGTQSWDYGDGTTAGNPHQFPTPGLYIVTHTVTNTCGTSTTTKIIKTESCCTCNAVINEFTPNYVTDGDFYNPIPPMPPFASTYTPVPVGIAPGRGQYSEVPIPSPYPWGQPLCTPSDHTPGGGTNFLFFAGKIGSGDAIIWKENNNGPGWMLSPTHRQTFCFKASFLNPDYAYPAKPSVKLIVKACGVYYTVATLDYLPYNDHCGWTTICGCWTAPIGCFHLDEIEIVMASSECAYGNEIAVDDIIFVETQETCNSTCGSQSQHDNNGYQFTPQKNKEFEQNNDMKGQKQGDLMNNPKADEKTGLSEIHPIPVLRGQDLHVTYTSDNSAEVLVQILDNSGAILMTKNAGVKSGANDIIMKTNTLLPGSYVLKATGERGSQSRVVIVQ